MSDEDVKTASDNIDWKIVDQLHDATLKISNDCFEYKKLCVAVVAGVIALMVRFGSEQNLQFVLAVCGLVCLGFWFSDATAYFYQRSLRRTMTRKINSIAVRNGAPEEPNLDQPTMAAAIFNRSMALYFVLILIIFILWLLF
mgnify:CR=1 FL=1|tara:strand:+ start:6155 stop:6580 length:426 start_codon:yes stop_codon:yes gene_type:complete